MALHEGVHIQGIELGFLQIKLEKALDVVLKFDYPQELAFVFESVEVAVGAEQGKPGLQHGFAVVAGAGVAHGVLVGVVDMLAILDACRTQVGNQAHNGRVGAVKLAELYSLSNRITNWLGQSGI